MHLVERPSNKVSQISKLCDNLFSPGNDNNKRISPMMVDMGVTAEKMLVAELQNKNKATVEHLSSVKSKFSWSETSALHHIAGQDKMVVNVPAERSYGAMTTQLQCVGCIGLHNAGGVSHMQ
eukprot:14057402-Ditylum_brightwellii.AAC.1